MAMTEFLCNESLVYPWPLESHIEFLCTYINTSLVNIFKRSFFHLNTHYGGMIHNDTELKK